MRNQMQPILRLRQHPNNLIPSQMDIKLFLLLSKRIFLLPLPLNLHTLNLIPLNKRIIIYFLLRLVFVFDHFVAEQHEDEPFARYPMVVELDHFYYLVFFVIALRDYF